MPMDPTLVAIQSLEIDECISNPDLLQCLDHPPICQNDIYIMETLDEAGYMAQQLTQLNACIIYLKVTTLAMIIDYTGTQELLPQMLSQPCYDISISLDNISTSLLTCLANIALPLQDLCKLWM